MAQNRVFFPQAALDQWLVDGKIELDENVLVIKAEGRKYRMVEAIRVLAEVSGAPDEQELVGRVKSVNFLVELGAELLGDSMVLGDNAFEVVPGWAATPVGSFSEHRAEAAAPTAADPRSDEDLLAQYLMLNL